MNNERGCAIVVAIMVLAILTLICTAGLQNSITESRISTNCLIHDMEFYGAESALSYGPIWAENNVLPVDDPDTYDASIINLDPITLGNEVTFTTEISYVDVINRVEPISKMPDINVKGTGTHPRKGIAAVEQIFRYIPAFQDPGAPIRSWSDRLTIQGNPNIDAGYNLCDGESTPPEVLYDTNDVDSDVEYVGSVECPAGDGVCNDGVSSVPIAWGNMRQNIIDLATDKVEPDANGKVAANYGTEDDPAVVYVDASTAAVEIQGGDGYGILFIDGDVDTISGNFEWHGIVVVNGKVNNKLTGTVKIFGALFLNNEESALLDEDEEVWGNLTVRYDCDALNLLNNDISGYKPTPTWNYVW